jgi:hypothetical protein
MQMPAQQPIRAAEYYTNFADTQSISCHIPVRNVWLSAREFFNLPASMATGLRYWRFDVGLTVHAIHATNRSLTHIRRP